MVEFRAVVGEGGADPAECSLVACGEVGGGGRIG